MDKKDKKDKNEKRLDRLEKRLEKLEGGVSIPLKVKKLLEDNVIQFEFENLKKNEILELVSKRANKDGCWCNPGGGGC